MTANCLLAYARVLRKLKLKSEAKECEQAVKPIIEEPAAKQSTAYTVDVKALRQGW